MRKLKVLAVAVLVCLVAATAAYAAMKRFTVKPDEFEPEKTPLVNAAWLPALGCPTAARTAQFNADFTDTQPGTPFTDPACPTGDPKDKHVEGLLLNKTGPTANAAAAVARINGVKGETLVELGFDIRKPGTPLAAPPVHTGGKTDDRGSHCGAGAPRFNISTNVGFFFLGCQAMIEETKGIGWVRLRAVFPFAGIPAGAKIERLTIVYDEGYDIGPDNFGMAILDNINVNGVMVGHGPTDSN